MLRLKKFSLILVVFFCSFESEANSFCFSTPDSSIVATVEIGNASENIDDGYFVVKDITSANGGEFSGGVYWTKNSLSSDVRQDSVVREGLAYSVTVFSDKGDTLVIETSLEANSITEKLNSGITPVVNFLSGILFWDPFAAIGLHDGCIEDDNGKILRHPNGDAVAKSVPFIVVWLIFGAVFFTIRTKFINVRGLKYSIGLLRGKYDEGEKEGEVTHFQALTTALSATVGLGNIAGVAIAIVAGGPGAIFWMIVAGFLGMASKFVECTLGVKYRKVVDGEVSGGPMYYLSRGLAKKKLKGLGKVLAVLFAILCVGGSLGGGNMFQSNQAFAQLESSFPAMEGMSFVFGVILALLVGVVIIGGIKKIAKVTDKIVPIMCGLYVLFALIIIGLNITHIGEAFSKIITGAFSGDAIKGGVIGVLIQGFRRAAFSNEAGVGSASIAHAAVKTDKPVTEGLVALLEPVIDTIIVCTMTALVLIFTGFDAGGVTGETGAKLTSLAFESVFPWFSYVLVIAILLFAFSTMISWSYYGQKAWEYLFGRSKMAEYSYKLMFLVFIVIGASVDLGAVLDFSDLMILGMAVPNMIGLFILLPEVRSELSSFIEDVKEK